MSVGGVTQTLAALNVRATEYTVGSSGPSAMSAPLPPNSAYTYAVEFSVDEADSAGAKGVTFSQPIINYVENFLGFPAGNTANSRILTIPLSDAALPASLKRIDLQISLAGRIFTHSFPPTPDQTYTFTWDGLDSYGRSGWLG